MTGATSTGGRTLGRINLTILGRLWQLPGHQGTARDLRSDDTLPDGTLYPAINALKHQGLIDPSAGPRGHYRLTPAGVERFRQERDLLAPLLFPDRQETRTGPDQERAPTPHTPAEQFFQDVVHEVTLFLLLPGSTRPDHRQSLVLLGDDHACKEVLAQAMAAVTSIRDRQGRALTLTRSFRPYPTGARAEKTVTENIAELRALGLDLRIDIWTDTELLLARHRPHGLNAQEEAVLSAIHSGSTLHDRNIYLGEALDLSKQTQRAQVSLNGRVKILCLWATSWTDHHQQQDAFWAGGGLLSADPERQLRSYQKAGRVPSPRFDLPVREALDTRLGTFLSLRDQPE